MAGLLNNRSLVKPMNNSVYPPRPGQDQNQPSSLEMNANGAADPGMQNTGGNPNPEPMPAYNGIGTPPRAMDDSGGQQDPGQADGDQPADGTGGGDQPNVTPEEQAQYDQFVNNAYKLVYNDKVLPTVLQRLASPSGPVDGLAAATVMVVMRTEDSAKQSGAQISPDVVFSGGTEILSDLADLAGKAKIHNFTEKEVEAATYRAADLYREISAKRGTLDVNGAKQDLSAFEQADKSGQLQQMFPDAGNHFTSLASSGQGPDGPQPGAMPGGQQPKRGLTAYKRAPGGAM